jgi:hypothetical protein
VDETETDADGGYLFTGVSAGSYRIQVIAPSGMALTATDTGSDDEADSDILSSGQSDLFTLALGDWVTDLDAGLTGTPTGISRLGGQLFIDADGDGIRDAGEAGAAYTIVELLDATGAVVATAMTEADGGYSFADVAAGSYRVKVWAPAGYHFTLANQGSDESADSDVTNSTAGTTDLFSYSGGLSLDIGAGLEEDA